ncbi:hypothetical protein GCM10011405_39680 [Rufibacter glacialis]|nr:hypothetical protein GCM10011405_39680 [Rufibacter glacialis]
MRLFIKFKVIIKKLDLKYENIMMMVLTIKKPILFLALVFAKVVMLRSEVFFLH